MDRVDSKAVERASHASATDAARNSNADDLVTAVKPPMANAVQNVLAAVTRSSLAAFLAAPSYSEIVVAEDMTLVAAAKVIARSSLWTCSLW